MSLVFMHGADDGIITGHYTVVGSAGFAAGRNGNAIRLSSAGAYFKRLLASNEKHATLIVGAYITIPAWHGNTDLITVYGDDGATPHVILRMQGYDNLQVLRGDGTLLTQILAFKTNVLYSAYFELKVYLHDSAGTVNVQHNGAALTALDYTGDTKNGGTATVLDAFSHEAWDNGPNSSDYEDIYCCNGAGAVNNTFLGDVKVVTLLPNGNGAASQWSGSDGNSVDNYLLVDEATPSMTDYVAGDVIGEADSYAFGAVGTTGTIKGVAVTAVAVKQGADNTAISLTGRSGASEHVSTSTAITGNEAAVSRVIELNPATSAAWTIAEVDAAEFGIKIATP